MENNVLVAVFKVDSEGYQALTELRQAAQGESYLVSAAALVKKSNGACAYLDGFDTGVKTADDTAIGGLIGMMVGIIGGPLGMLLGAGIGTMTGANVDAADALVDAAMLEQIVGKLDDGTVAIIADVTEKDPEELDGKLSAFDAVIARFDAEVVAKEAARAAEMQQEMARMARLELRKEKKEELRKKIEEKKEAAQKISEENIGLIKDEFDK